ncbi:hypothetical protein PMAYCL1PPCAC_21462, partial [Pristionchus mayeri]
TLAIFAPIVTIDFGVDGEFNMTAKSTFGKFKTSALSSTVFMSPGYTGCQLGGENRGYHTKRNTIYDSITMAA